jgi:hypothetical protein
MKMLEAVTVCVHYADFLREVIPFNRPHFDRWLIVTSPGDHATLDLCRQWNLEVLVTDDFTRGGDSFNKGRAIERGLAMLAHGDWLLHLDADIVLPNDYRESLLDADLDPSCIYGVDRLMIPDWDAWQKLKRSGLLRRSHHCYLSSHGYQVGARWCDVRFGWTPIGFHQLWNQHADQRHGIRLRRYPDNHQDAARADVKFSIQWDRRRRVLLPEVLVAHLESEPSPTGVNWKGRTSRQFGPMAGKPTSVSC